MTPSNRCQHGRLLSTSKATGPQGCPERAVEGRFYCARHTAERMAAVELLPPEKRLKPQRWGQTYMVSGSSRE